MKYDFAQRLKKARLDAGLTQRELDSKCGKVGSCVSHYERGFRSPGIDTIRLLMKHLKVDANYLLK